MDFYLLPRFVLQVSFTFLHHHLHLQKLLIIRAEEFQPFPEKFTVSFWTKFTDLPPNPWNAHDAELINQKITQLSTQSRALNPPAPCREGREQHYLNPFSFQREIRIFLVQKQQETLKPTPGIKFLIYTASIKHGHSGLGFCKYF